MVPAPSAIPLYWAIAFCCRAVQVPADRHATYWSAVADGAGVALGAGAGAAVAVALGVLTAAGGAGELPPQPPDSSPAAQTAIRAGPPFTTFIDTLVLPSGRCMACRRTITRFEPIGGYLRPGWSVLMSMLCTSCVLIMECGRCGRRRAHNIGISRR